MEWRASGVPLHRLDALGVLAEPRALARGEDHQHHRIRGDTAMQGKILWVEKFLSAQFRRVFEWLYHLSNLFHMRTLRLAARTGKRFTAAITMALRKKPKTGIRYALNRNRAR